MKKKIFFNHKATLNKEEVYDYILNLEEELVENYDFVIFPSFCYLSIFAKLRVFLGAQNVAESDKYNQTGEITARILKSMGVDYCLVGHSERRINQKEDSKSINKKIRALLRENIKPVLCVGETLEEYKAGKTMGVIARQIDDALEDIKLARITIAYEPVWAIGTGITPTLKEIEKVHKFIFNHVKKKNIYVEILYGGSVNSKNIKSFMSDDIDGFLIGSASCDKEEVTKILEFSNE